MIRQTLTGRTDAPPRIDSAPAIGLAWLVRLRWAFAAANLVVAGGATLQSLPVSWPLVLAASIGALLTNGALLVWMRRGRSASRLLLAGVLVLDGVLLTLALRGAGGATNPFSVLYLVHVALAALLLDGRATWLVAGVTCLGFGTLFLGGDSHAHHHHAHHGGHGAHDGGLDAHLRGMLAAYAVAAAFVGYSVYRVARALERREREMVALQKWAARTEKLASLSALAAGAAHELGTPLGTIAVVAKELERAAANDATSALEPAVLAADARLVREEAERCRSIIAKMSSNAGEGPGSAPRPASIESVIQEVRASIGEPRATELRIEPPPAGAFVVAPRDALVQALANLVANAFDACEASAVKEVVLAATVGGERVSFRIEDTGQGVSDDLVARLGEPFFSTKPGRGMGLGLFLARSLAERVGGRLEMETRPAGGSTFVLEIPGGLA